MNVKNLLVVLSSAAVLTSCSSAYRSGQTPDDVYYSPSRPQQQDEYVDVERQQGRYNDRNGTSNNYDDYDGYRDDRFLRMSMGSPYRLSAYNDYMLYNGYMGFNNFRYNSVGMGFNNPWNSFYYWNSFYNPYTSYDFYNPYYYGGLGGGYIPGAGGGVIVKSPSVNPVSRPRAFNPGAYTPNSLGNANRYLDRPAASNGSYRTPINSGSRYNNRNSNNSGLGNTMRRVLGGSGESSYYNNGRSTNSANNRNSGNNSNNNTYTAPQRTYEAPTRSYSPPPASSGGGNSGGGGGGGVSRPTRGGN